MRFNVPFVLIPALSAAGCAHLGPPTEKDPRVLLSQVCATGAAIQSAQGSAYLKASSKDASGQFPAEVKVTAPSSLRMEVTNPFGGLEAVITIQGKEYVVDSPSHPERSQRGSQTWGGIPLDWATDLFLGRFPCPDRANLTDSDSQVSSQGQLEVQTHASLSQEPQKFVYLLKELWGRPWVESLHWERGGVDPLSIDFKFYDPEPESRSPLRWEAKSLQGEVKVRWNERQVR